MKHNQSSRFNRASQSFTHRHNLGSIKCTLCGVSRSVEFDCQVTLPKRECPEPGNRRRTFVCFKCADELRSAVREQNLRVALVRGAEIRPGVYDAATVFGNLRELMR